jgi:hypothetical protein
MPTSALDPVTVEVPRTLVIEFSGHVTDLSIDTDYAERESYVDLNVTSLPTLYQPAPVEARLALPTSLVDFAPELFRSLRVPAARVRVEIDV